MNRKTHLASFLALALAIVPASFAAEVGLRAGTAIVDVTPQEWPLTLRGSFFPKPAKTSHDPLHVRALAFENGKGRAVIVIVDVIGISRETLDPIKKRAAEATGWRADQMLIAATHTHSAPSSSESGSVPQVAFGKRLADGMVEAIEKAVAGDSEFITGVIVGFSADPSALDKQYNPASTERVAFVANDPDLIFEIQADGAVPAASMGLNAVTIYTHAGSTTTGLSGVELDTTSDAPAADASNTLLIVNAVNREDNDTTITHAKVEVLINRHTERPGATAGALGI